MSAPTGLRGPVLAGVAGKAAEAITLVLLATLVPRLLGPVDYGLFSVGSTVVTLGALALTLGGPTLLARYVPAAPEEQRPAVAYALTVRLARNRAALLGALAVVAVGLAGIFPPVAVTCVFVALALTVAATLVLQADLGLGRPLAWCLRYPVQNAVLVATVITLYGPLGLDGAWTALLVAAVAGAVVAVAASGPLRQGAADPPVPPPPGALRFGLLQAAGAALAQVVHRGGVLAVALLAGPAAQTGFAALAISIALAATYAVAQLFTVALPVVITEGTSGEDALRHMASLLLGVVTAVAIGVAAVVDVVVPAVFGASFTGAAPAFVPALAMVVLAPVTALTVQVAALRTQPSAVLRGGIAGALAFLVTAAVAVPTWGAAGATTAALAGTATIAVGSAVLLPGAVRTRLALATTAAVAAVLTTGALL